MPDHCCGCARSEDRREETIAVLDAAATIVAHDVSTPLKSEAEALLSTAFATAKGRLSPTLDRMPSPPTGGPL